MNKNSRDRQSSRERQNTQTQQGRGSDDCPFPNKPILHRRSYKPATQNSLDPKDLERMTISKETRGSPLPQDHHFKTREAAGSHHRRKDAHRKANGEVHTARAIQVKKLLVGAKLWRVEEQIRQKMSDEAAAANGEIRDESRRRGGGQPRPDKAPANRQPSVREQRDRDDARLRWRRRRGRRDEAMVRDEEEEAEEEEQEEEEEEEDRWRTREAADRNFVGGRRRASRKRDESRSEDTRDHARDGSTWGETPSRPQDRREASFVDRDQSSFSGCRRRKEERPPEDTYTRYERQDTSRRRRPVDRLATAENQRGAERDAPEGPPPAPVSSLPLYSQPQREELEPAHDSDAKLFPCFVCQKTFLRERLQTHEKICKKIKIGRKKRPQFVSATQRVYTGGDASPL